MEIFWMCLGWLFIGFGVLGCFVNKIPGPMMAFLGLLIMVWGTPIECDSWVLALVALMVIVSMILTRRLLPKIGKLVAEYGRAGNWGTMIGSFIGLIALAALAENDASGTVLLIMLLVSFVGLPYLFAFILETISRKSAQEGAQAALGALFAFMVGTMLKLAVCAYSIYTVVTN